MHRPDIAPRAGAYHLSLITYHLSLITYHLSLITYHLSLITYHLSLITQQMFADALPRWHIAACRDTCSAFLHACCADAVLCLRDAHRIFSVEQLTPCHTSSLVVTNPGTISTCNVHGQELLFTLCITVPTATSMYAELPLAGLCCIIHAVMAELCTI